MKENKVDIVRYYVAPTLLCIFIIIILFLVFGNLETLFIDFLNKARGYQSSYAITSFFILASDIVLPVPSSIIMFTNGLVLGITKGSLLSVLSVMIGSVIGYYLGRFTSYGLKIKSGNNADSFIQRYGELAILVTRAIPILAESVCIVAGYNKMKFGYYIVLNLLGYIPVILVYSICGNAGYGKSAFILSVSASLLISAVFWFCGRRITQLFSSGDKLQAENT